MSKFKVGDKVVAGAADTGFMELLRRIQGVKDYYTVTRNSAGGYWLQLDGMHYFGDPVPWCAEYSNCTKSRTTSCRLHQPQCSIIIALRMQITSSICWCSHIGS